MQFMWDLELYCHWILFISSLYLMFASISLIFSVLQKEIEHILISFNTQNNLTSIRVEKHILSLAYNFYYYKVMGEASWPTSQPIGLKGLAWPIKRPGTNFCQPSMSWAKFLPAKLSLCQISASQARLVSNSRLHLQVTAKLWHT